MRQLLGSRVSGIDLGGPRDWSIGFLLLAALVSTVAYTVGWGALLAPWRELRPVDLLLFSTLSALSYFLRAVRVYDYFRPRFHGRFPTVLRLSILHNVANNLLPMRAGELVFPWLMGRYFGHGFGRSLASLVWIRLLDLHFLGLIALFVLYLRDPWLPWLVAGMLWVALLPLVYRIACSVPEATGGPFVRLRNGLLLAAPASSHLAVRLYLWTTLSWAAKFIAFTLVLEHFLPLDLWRVLIGVLGAELSSVLPFHGIAGAGSYELAVVAALLPFGVSAEAALSGAVNLHLFLLGMTLMLGLSALLMPVTMDRDPGMPG